MNFEKAAMSLIQLKNVSLTYNPTTKPVKVLEDLSFSADAGKSISIVGPSGSGKTSLLMVMAGLESPTTGSVNIAGQEITGLDEDSLARFRRDNLSIVFQAFRLLPTMTALENVSLPLELANVSGHKDKALSALEKVELGKRWDHYPGQLSGGEQQRVALARAIVTQPAVMLADEPTGNLDQKTGKAVMDQLFEVCKESNTTLILVTHDPKLAERCEQSYAVNNGKLKKAI